MIPISVFSKGQNILLSAIISIISIILPGTLLAQRRCTGSASCQACTNCKYCKYCNSGGSCDVCKPSQAKATVKSGAQVAKSSRDFFVFNKEEPDDDNINSYEVVVSNLKSYAFTTKMWPLIDKIVTLNRIDTNSQRMTRIYIYIKVSDGYYCYYQKIPNGEATIEY